MKKLLLLLGFIVFSSSVNAKTDTKEDMLLKRFADATQAHNLQAKCQATKDLLAYYKKVGNKNRMEMAQGILKRDCKRYN